MSGLIDTTEMYLRTILELEEEGVVPMRARIAERLDQSGPTVSQTVARMERDGLVPVAGDRHLELTEEGRRLATRVMRKHRLAECLLVDVIGLEWEQVHAEACRWEHVMSEAVERRVLELLRHPTESPYGNPIPGLEELGEKDGADPFLDEGMVQPGRARPGRGGQDRGRAADRRADPDGRPADVHAAAGRGAARLRGERDGVAGRGAGRAAAARRRSWTRRSPRTCSSPSADAVGVWPAFLGPVGCRSPARVPSSNAGRAESAPTGWSAAGSGGIAARGAIACQAEARL